MLATRKRPLPLLAVLTFVLVLILYHRDHADRIYQQWSTSMESHPMKLQAANVTDVQLTIPAQPQWTEGDVQRFINGQSNVQRGSILAWLGHHNALRW
jgi:hypothetical protein